MSRRDYPSILLFFDRGKTFVKYLLSMLLDKYTILCAWRGCQEVAFTSPALAFRSISPETELLFQDWRKSLQHT